MRQLCVYCGSSPGEGGRYVRSARALGEELASRGIGLVYGGSSKGLMGVLADAVLEAGGTATGVMPRALVAKEIAHRGLSELHVTDSMHERKAMMERIADGFVALPGGFGTLEEIIEVLTWGQLEFHEKPCGLLNVAGYFDSLLGFLDHATGQGFVRPAHREMLIVAEDPPSLLDRYAAYRPPRLAKWRD